ncbi:MAG: MmcQ/YjbR family DNA-binding protein, partial [Gemmataceae bacterium]|nr:MmcQ/YjbR family DNA-binding protein [Gemmataceae bacterium]
AAEAAHMDHPDFRVRGKIFASLGPDEDWGMVKLTPDEQQAFVLEQPAAFQPFPGAWGTRGCTKVLLQRAKSTVVRRALIAAWRTTAPKRLAQEFEDE